MKHMVTLCDVHAGNSAINCSNFQLNLSWAWEDMPYKGSPKIAFVSFESILLHIIWNNLVKGIKLGHFIFMGHVLKLFAVVWVYVLNLNIRHSLNNHFYDLNRFKQSPCLILLNTNLFWLRSCNGFCIQINIYKFIQININ